MSDAVLVPLKKCDNAALEALLDDAFGLDRKGRTAYRLRRNSAQIEKLSFGLLARNRLIGSIQSWPVKVMVRDGHSRLVLVGPVAVHPDIQNSGHGHILMRAMAMLAAAKDMNDPAMVMVGDEEYYGRFGFTAKATGGWSLPGPWMAHRLLLRNPAGHPLPREGMLKADN